MEKEAFIVGVRLGFREVFQLVEVRTHRVLASRVCQGSPPRVQDKLKQVAQRLGYIVIDSR